MKMKITFSWDKEDCAQIGKDLNKATNELIEFAKHATPGVIDLVRNWPFGSAPTVEDETPNETVDYVGSTPVDPSTNPVSTNTYPKENP